MNNAPTPTESLPRIYWTAFIGLFFDFYDLYLFIYLEKVLVAQFNLAPAQSDWLQFSALAAVGVGSLSFGYLADRWGRGRVMLVVFGVYALGIAGISLATGLTSLVTARIVASLALGAEWGISHTYVAERVPANRRYRFAALLQFSLLGGLLAALSAKFLEPVLGWRLLFGLSIVPVALLSAVRWRALAVPSPDRERSSLPALAVAISRNSGAFLLCLALASLTIASGTLNVFYSKELPQSPWFPVVFWSIVAPGMLAGAASVKRLGVGRTLMLYGLALLTLSLVAWKSHAASRAIVFSLTLSFCNGVPFGLMGALFNEMFSTYRTMLSGAAYNLGRIAAGYSPKLIRSLGLEQDGNYFLFTAVLGVLVLVLGNVLIVRRRSDPSG
ncbi:MAG TPA: MFS transporter [Candidatus Didemnitutus sp.]|nr:MFS transporter [Candidatus Didemnitutus sp.]